MLAGGACISLVEAATDYKKWHTESVEKFNTHFIKETWDKKAKHRIWKRILWGTISGKSAKFDRPGCTGDSHGIGKGIVVQILATKNVSYGSEKYLCAWYRKDGFLLGNVKKDNITFDKKSWTISPYVGKNDASYWKKSLGCGNKHELESFSAPKRSKSKPKPKPRKGGYDDLVCSDGCADADCTQVREALKEIFSALKDDESDSESTPAPSKTPAKRSNRNNRNKGSGWDTEAITKMLGVAVGGIVALRES